MNRIRQEIDAAALGAVTSEGFNGERSFRLTEEFSGFSGHFPGYAILPAVVQMLLAQTVAEQLIGDRLSFVGLKRAKFVQQIRPEQPVTVRVQCEEQDSLWSCSCELRVEDRKAASFVLQFHKGHNA